MLGFTRPLEFTLFCFDIPHFCVVGFLRELLGRSDLNGRLVTLALEVVLRLADKGVAKVFFIEIVDKHRSLEILRVLHEGGTTRCDIFELVRLKIDHTITPVIAITAFYLVHH